MAVTGRRLAADEPLPIPATLTELVHSRLARLPAATRDVLLVVSALAVPTMRLVAAAVGDARAGAAVERASRVGVLVAERDRLGSPIPCWRQGFTRMQAADGASLFTVGSLRSSPTRRNEPTISAWPLRTRRGVAAALESAALLALKRGAPSTAAEFYEQAGRLTPPADGDGIRRRLLGAARCHAAAGSTPRARQLIEQVLSTTLPGPGRAEALLLLSGGEFGDLASESVGMLEQALDEAAGRPALEARILVELVSVQLGRWDIPAAAVHARVALAAAEQAGDPATLSRALVAAGRLEVFQGRPLGIQLVQRAESMQPVVEEARIASLPSGWIGTLLRYMDDFDGARTRLEPLLSRAGQLGDDSSTGELLYELSELECWAGNWEQALAYARHSVEIQTQADRKWDLTNALAALAFVEAHLGRVEASCAHATEGLAIAQSIRGGDETLRNARARRSSSCPCPDRSEPSGTSPTSPRSPQPSTTPVCSGLRATTSKRSSASPTSTPPNRTCNSWNAKASPSTGPGGLPSPDGAVGCSQRPRRSRWRRRRDRRRARTPPAGADAVRTRPHPARRRKDPAPSTAAP